MAVHYNRRQRIITFENDSLPDVHADKNGYSINKINNKNRQPKIYIRFVLNRQTQVNFERLKVIQICFGLSPFRQPPPCSNDNLAWLEALWKYVVYPQTQLGCLVEYWKIAQLLQR